MIFLTTCLDLFVSAWRCRFKSSKSTKNKIYVLSSLSKGSFTLPISSENKIQRCDLWALNRELMWKCFVANTVPGHFLMYWITVSTPSPSLWKAVFTQNPQIRESALSVNFLAFLMGLNRNKQTTFTPLMKPRIHSVLVCYFYLIPLKIEAR